ncbi:MAG: hypothetical protein A3K12_06630 [Candidatus Rokubacteria bacterium RIFCSPLOWO2_12_FULL_71_19]|nr:MAG: hypothetical protein A3K12_06630 [Candidatus Rokubacteria bacterium RIFCSPLOWO2_12_FULL_71_19]
MVRIYELITQVARMTATVLVQGESGTGKELGVHRNTVLAKLMSRGVRRPGEADGRTAFGP